VRSSFLRAASCLTPCSRRSRTGSASIKVTGSTQIVGVTVSFSADFKIGDTDDNCGSNYIDLQNSSGAFYYIPDGKDDDTTNPAPPYYNGTSDLHWAGFGIQRL
jgi:hypothetical protein